MKPATVERAVLTNAAEGVYFGISKSNEAHIMGILRDSLYTDKILAVLREYGANAWDAHQMAGKADVPIKVTLPTYDDLFLVIRDFGPGLSKDDAFNIFAQYGESTKRSSDAAVGMLGIGAKSAFSYADSFTVISYHGGLKTTYVASLDETNRGVFNKLAEEPSDETGIEIRLAVKDDDVSTFRSKAENLFSYFEPQPEINCDLHATTDGETFKSSVGSVKAGTVDRYGGSYGDGDWVAVMGCVPYRIRLKDLNLPDEHACLRKLSGVLKFEIGELQISASREELQYKDKTVKAIQDKFTVLVDEYIIDILKTFDDPGRLPWEKRLHAQTLIKLDLPLADDITDYAKGWVRLFEDSDKGPFHVYHNGNTTNQISVSSDVKLYIDDTNKKLKGYRLSHHQYVIRPKGVRRVVTDAQTAELTKLTEEQLVANNLTGIPVLKLSSLYWWVSHSNRATIDPADRLKHRATMFKLDPEPTGFYRPFSRYWEVETRVATDDDVFIVLQDFVGHGDNNDFYQAYREDQRTAKALGEKLPTIYGYKHTEKKPVDQSKLKGTSYHEWREKWHKSLWTPERAKLVQDYFWAQVPPTIHHKTKESLAKTLGGKHPITRFLCAPERAKKRSPGAFKDAQKADALSTLARSNGLTDDTSDAKKEEQRILSKYPLLSIYGLDAVWSCEHWKPEEEKKARRDAWIDYIKGFDSKPPADPGNTP